MKRKIFTFVAAAAITAATVLPAAAAERTGSVPTQECFQPSWNCYIPSWDGCRPNWLCQLPCVPCPDGEETPSVPDAPEQEETPSVPDTPEQEETVPDVPSVDLSGMTQLEQAACELVNEERQANGLEPLEISAELSVKARIKAQDMRDNNYFSHTSPTYGSPFAMMQSLGITYRTAGENIAMGYQVAEAVVEAWMNSPSHRANILSASYDTMGIGHTDGYWAQWFIG